MSVHIILLMIVRFHFYFLSSLSLLCVHRHYAFDFCFQELFCSVQLSYEYRKIWERWRRYGPCVIYGVGYHYYIKEERRYQRSSSGFKKRCACPEPQRSLNRCVLWRWTGCERMLCRYENWLSETFPPAACQVAAKRLSGFPAGGASWPQRWLEWLCEIEPEEWIRQCSCFDAAVILREKPANPGCFI